jgi:hypothetical protein
MAFVFVSYRGNRSSGLHNGFPLIHVFPIFNKAEFGWG